LVFFEAVDEVFDGVAIGSAGGGGSDGVWTGSTTGLDRDELVVVIAGHRAFGAGDDESAAGLGLDFPRIGEGAPTGFELGEAVGVTRDDDCVFVYFESGRAVDDGGDLERAAAALEPSSEGGPVAEVVEKGATSLVFLVEPRVWFCGVDLFAGESLFVGAMPEGATVSAEVPYVENFTDDALLNELMRFSVGPNPLQGPVDHEGSVRRHCADHAVRFFERSGERFLNDDVHVEGGDLAHPLAVLGCGWAEDDDVRLCFCEALVVVSEDAVAGDLEFADGVLHSVGVDVTDSDEFRARMVGDSTKEVAHVKMVEVDTGDAPFAGSHRGEEELGLWG
jgi:hypothetical protein